MAQLVVVNNPFNPDDKTVSSIDGGLALFHLLENANEDIEFVVSINGKITEDYKHIVRQDDFIAIVPIPKGGGGGKNPLRTIAMLALAIVAPMTGTLIAQSMSGIYATTGIYSATLAAVASGAVMIGGGMLINTLMPPPTPSVSTNNSLEEISPTYSFSGGSNVREEGTALPIILGEARVTPPIISSYLSTDDDKQYLNVLMAVNDGTLESISDIEINSQSVSNFSDISIYTTSGTSNQPIIPNFHDTITTVSLNRNLNDIVSTTYTTASNIVDELEVSINLPKGHFKVTDSGDYELPDSPVSFQIEYKKVSDSNWITFGFTTYEYKYSYEEKYDPIWQWRYGEEVLSSGEYISTEYKGDTFTESGTALNPNYDGENDEYIVTKKTYTFVEKIETTNNDYNGMQLDTDSDIHKTTHRLTYKIKNLESSTYDVKVSRLSNYSEDTRTANDLQLEYINEVIYDDFTYPNVALLGVKALATDQLNGSFPIITCIAKSELLYVDGIDLTMSKSNPAVACFSLLIQENIPLEDINLDEFKKWYDYCIDEGFTCNLYLDSQQELQSALNMVAILGRAVVVQKGSVFTPIISNVVDTPTQGFLFTSGNIIEGSFTLDYIPYNDRANVVEVTYYDATNNYKAKTVQVQSNDFDSTTRENKSSITLYGCTDRTIALRYANFLLKQNKYVSETVSFSADVDAIACSVGDVIKVGVKYMTNTLASGRIISATSDGNNTIVELDQEVSLQSQETYELQYRTLEDEIIVIEFTPSFNGDTDIITIPNPQTMPSKHDVFAIGTDVSEATNLYRVVNISRDTDMKRKVVAVEYNPDVYNDAVTDVQVEEAEIIGGTTITSIEEIVNIERGREVREYLVVSFKSSSFLNTIYLDDKKYGTTDNNTMTIDIDFIKGKRYKIGVNNVYKNHTWVGSIESIPNSVPQVSNVSHSYNDGVYKISWDDSLSGGLSHYIVEVGTERHIIYTNFIKLYDLSLGEYTILITTVNIENNFSTPVSYILNVDSESLTESTSNNKVSIDDLDTRAVANAVNITLLDGKLTEKEAELLVSIHEEAVRRLTDFIDNLLADAIADGTVTSNEQAVINKANELQTVYNDYANTVANSLTDAVVDQAEIDLISTKEAILNSTKTQLEALLSAINNEGLATEADFAITQNALASETEARVNNDQIFWTNYINGAITADTDVKRTETSVSELGKAQVTLKEEIDTSIDFLGNNLSSSIDEVKTSVTDLTETTASIETTLTSNYNDLSASISSIDTVSANAYSWSASASQLITAPDGSITGWQFADGSNTNSTFKISADSLIIQGSSGTIDIDNSNITIPTNISDLSNDEGFIASSEVANAINTNTTTINGAKITTGTINAAQLDADISISTGGYVVADGNYSGTFGTTCISGNTSYSSEIGVWGGSSTSSYAGVMGVNNSGYGVLGSSTGGQGVRGISVFGYGVYGSCAGGEAGYFNGDVTVTGVVTNFTGAHFSITDEASVIIGDIATEVDNIAIDVNDTYSRILHTTTAKDVGVFGVVSYISSNSLEKITDMTHDDNDVLMPKYADLYNIASNPIYTLIKCNAVGEGMINVCEAGGDISRGDYICSSNIRGKGMKQDDDIHHNYTAAKAMLPINQPLIWANEVVGEDGVFMQDGVKCKMIACIYTCG